LTLSLDGPVKRSLDRKCEEKLGLEWPISNVGCPSVSSCCLTAFTSQECTGAVKTATSMVYDHRKTGLYTKGVRTVRSVQEGKRTLATTRYGERARSLKPFDTAQEFKLGRIVSHEIPVGLIAKCSS
jgi:hypothetical protein